MRKSQRKVKITEEKRWGTCTCCTSSIAGKASCVGLLLLAFLLANPLGSLSASALEDFTEDGVVAAETGELVAQSDDGAAQAEVLTSTVSFSFGEPVGVTTLTPVSAEGASARYSVKATVGVENSGGYTVYLGSNKSELTGKNSGATIDGVNSSSSYEDLPVNSWGYNATEGEAAGTSFLRMPENVRGVVLGGNDASSIKSDSKTFTLSFAAHIGNDKPADTYENEVTLSVVSSPLEITGLTFITNLQEMTPEICGASEVGDTKQLVDLRDNKSYWVAKLPDNNCWMVQNLALDLSTSVALTSEDSDVTSNWTPGYSTAMTVTTNTVDSSSITTRSWNLGSYIITSPTSVSDCGNPKHTLGDCPSQFTSTSSRVASANSTFYTDNGNKTFTASEYDAHYLVGNYYTWNAATAGTGQAITSGQAAGSICPKGWRLPISNTTISKSFSSLVSAGNIGSSVFKIVTSPYFFVRGGMVDPSSGYLFSHAGTYGLYWSSTPASNRTV